MIATHLKVTIILIILRRGEYFLKAAVATKEKTVGIVEKELRPLQYGEALVEMEYCGVCHTDLHVKNGDYGDVAGVVIGHEGVGKVIEIAEGVNSLSVGDRVAIPWLYETCENCEYCTTGRETLCRSLKATGYSVDGAMAEQAIVNADYVVKVPEGLDPAVATSITCAGVTTYKAVKISDVKPGGWIGVFGIGGVGSLAVQYAKNVFGTKVIAFDIHDEKLAFAKECGADVVINSLTEDMTKIFEVTEGKGLDACIVTASVKEPFNQAVGAVKAGGRVIAVGVPVDNMDIAIPRLVLDGIQIIGTLVGTRQDLQEAFQFAAEGKVVPKVTLRKIEEINEIMEEMEQGKFTGRMVIDFTK